MFSLGTGLMRFVNMGLMAVLALALVWGAWSAVKNNWVDQGREEVREQVEDDNQNLTNQVTKVNDEINHRVTVNTEVIDRRSRQIEDAINDQPSENLSNVSRVRLERVREQQRLSETDR